MSTEAKAKVPEHIQGAFDRWVSHGIHPGGFVTAVLENDLKGAFGRADAINLAHLQEIVMYCYWEIPSTCWGSPEKVATWSKQGGLEGLKATGKDGEL